MALLREFCSIMTGPRTDDPPSPSAVLLSEGETYWAALRDLLRASKVTGQLVHDANIATLCLSHGVGELWTADRDFGRFPRLKAVNPLV